MAINAQMNRVDIFGMLQQVQVIIYKSDALFNFRSLAQTLAVTSLLAAHLFLSKGDWDDENNE